MTDELIDLVNGKDEVTGEAMKSHAHTNGLIHRLAVVYVFYNGELLVQKRSPQKNGLLDHSVGGHVGKGESYEIAAQREMQEELGLKTPLSFVGKIFEDVIDPLHGFHFKHHFAIFEATLDDAQFRSMTPDSREAEQIIPMTLEKMAAAMLKNASEFTAGILRSFNEYIIQKNIAIKSVPLK